jgi:hypothetical protein
VESTGAGTAKILGLEVLRCCMTPRKVLSPRKHGIAKPRYRSTSKAAPPLARGPKKKPGRGVSAGRVVLRGLAVSYFRMGKPHTIIGAERFHFRVRNGIGWFPLAMATRQNQGASPLS